MERGSFRATTRALAVLLAAALCVALVHGAPSKKVHSPPGRPAARPPVQTDPLSKRWTEHARAREEVRKTHPERMRSMTYRDVRSTMPPPPYHQQRFVHRLHPTGLAAKSVNRTGLTWTASGKWFLPKIVFVYDEIGSGLSRTQVRLALEAAAATWMNVTSSAPRIRFLHRQDHYSLASVTPVNASRTALLPSSHHPQGMHRNRFNEIAFTNNTNALLGTQTLSLAYLFTQNTTTVQISPHELLTPRQTVLVPEIVEADLLFSSVLWMDFEHYAATSPAPNSRTYHHSAADFQAIATLTLGHALGLGYAEQHDHTMYGFSDVGEHHRASLEPGDIDGLRALYPPPPT